MLGPVGIVYPSTRSAALSNLAYHIIVGMLEEEGVGVRRYFLEDGMVVEAKRYKDSPTSNKALFVSLPYEIMYVDFIKMLDIMGIPVFRESRGEKYPIVIVGGPAVIGNPLPLYDIADAIFIGEVEPVIGDIIEALSKDSRNAILRSLSEVKGFIIPGYTSYPVERVYVEDLDHAWYPIRQELLEDVEPVWGKTFILETTRGCARGCRFCMEGFIFRPKRDRSFPILRKLLDEGVRVNNVSKVSFYSLIFFDNPAADKILEYAVSQGLEVSVPSLRAETLTAKRAELIARGGQKTITIAPETGSCVIAKAILKPIGPTLAMEAVENALEGGIKNIKLYLMTGFPGETEEDVKDTISMVSNIAKLVKGRGGIVKATLNPMMPKPQTPLQWLGFNIKEVEAKLSFLEKELSKAGVEVSTFNIKWALIEVAIGRSGKEMGRVLVEWARRGGSPSSFIKASKSVGVNIEAYLRTWSPEYTPPWNDLITSPYHSVELLRKEYLLYMDTVSSRNGTGKLRIPGCPN